MVHPPELKIVFENESLLVVEKPAGIPSQTTVDPRRPSAESLAQAHIGGEASCFLVHRLDADTTGLLVFTKSKAAATELTVSLRRREWTKVYWALTARCNQNQTDFMVENHLKAEKERRQRRTVSFSNVVRSGGDYALTKFSVLARSANGAALIEAQPQTGRMHQIRVHLAGLGMPIVGDPIYGPDAHPAEPLALHAAQLQFTFQGQPFRFTAPPPLSFVNYAQRNAIKVLSAIEQLRISEI